MRRALILAAAVLCCAAVAANAQDLGVLANLLFAHPPREPFDAAKAPPAPDYADPASWAALPARPGTSVTTPDSVKPIDPNSAQADVFFVHPTTFFSDNQWNQPIDDQQTRTRTDNGTIRNQASVFNGCCRIYAPRYRQMTFSGFLRSSPDSEAALNLAYSDVKRAFEYYLAHYNHSRPFIIAAHSQGSRLARTLIQEMIDGTKLRRQFVAGYIIGNWIDEDWFVHTLKTIKPCQHTHDTGCIISWSTLAEDADAHAQRVAFAKRSGIADPEAFANRKFFCINPLIWSTDGTEVPASYDLGGWIYGRGNTPRAPDAKLVGMRCVDGALYVSKPKDPAYRRALLPGGNYHNYDYQLAYMNIRQNASVRANAFVTAHQP